MQVLIVRVSSACPIGPVVGTRIIDAAGRVITSLGEGDRSAGRHRIRWDGKDAQGRPVPAGIYFAEVNGGVRRVARFVAIR